MALPRSHRLNLRFHRRSLSQQGVTSRTPLFTFVFNPNSLPHSRYAILLSRRLSPLAVTRNRLKRTLTSSLQRHLDQLPSGQDILIIPQKKSLSLSSSQLSQEIIRQINKLSFSSSAHENKKTSSPNR